MNTLSYTDPKTRWNRRFWLYAVLIFTGGLLLRLYLGTQFRGYVGDQSLFVDWMNTVHQYGIRESYLFGKDQNYPPLFIVILGLYRWVLDGLGITASAGNLSMKILPIAFDMLSMAVLTLTFKRLGSGACLLLLAVLSFNPGLLVDSAMWGQIDILHSTLMVLSTVLLLSNPLLAGLIFSVALLAKFQAIVIAPVIGIVLLRQLYHRQFRGMLLFAAGLMIATLPVFLYFAANGTLSAMLNNAYGSAVNMYPQLSLNAMNIWYHLLDDPATNDATVLFGIVTYKMLGLLLLAIAVVGVSAYLLLIKEIRISSLLIAGAAVNLAFFMLPTEIHERYSIPALLFFVLVPFFERKWMYAAIAFSLTTYVNIAMIMSTGSGGDVGAEEGQSLMGSGHGGFGGGHGAGFNMHGSGLTNGWIYGIGISIAMIHIVILFWVVYVMTFEVLNGRKKRS
ncbi:MULTISPECIES: hypothetical protein [Paenibacillus]|uniref:hypothetical protein n=1 Tax=Paenibacillus TaxID=44249 RepID=UPI000BA033F4|nr:MULTISPECIES: hypothetical protein [Paenibacillus]OZQ71313.1 hypothetical protein CA599_10090 [Paenibacillus taichungensis]